MPTYISKTGERCVTTCIKLNADVHAESKRLRINRSKFCERALAAEIQRRKEAGA